MTITQSTSSPPGFDQDGAANGPITLPTQTNLPNFNENNATLGPASDSDALSYLLEVRYAGIPFPCSRFEEESSQEVAVHKYPNLDGARVELTGRNPSIYSCRAVLTNNIYPGTKGSGETWKAGTLFPSTFEALLQVLYDSSAYHVLQHPFLGFRNVVPVHFSYSFASGGPRDGVFLDMSFVETIGDADIATTISAPSNLAVSQQTADSIDSEIATTKLQAMNPPNLSIGQFFSKVAGTIRNVVSYPNQAIQSINAQVVQVDSSIQGAGAAIATSPYQLFQTGNAIVNQNKNLVLHGPVSNAYYYDKAAGYQEFAFSLDALNTVYSTVGALNSNANTNAGTLIDSSIAFTEAMIAYYRVLNRIETATVIARLFEFLGQLQKTRASLFSNDRNYMVKTYVISNPTTLFTLSKTLNNSVDQLLSLNAGLNKKYLIQSGTKVKYYQG